MEETPPAKGAAANEPLPVRDEAAALAATGGDPELARELLSTLIAGLPREVAELDARYTAKDWEKLVQTAHRLRGATSYCGVPALDSALHHLERIAKEGDPAQIALQLQAVTEAAAALSELGS